MVESGSPCWRWIQLSKAEFFQFVGFTYLIDLLGSLQATIIGLFVFSHS